MSSRALQGLVRVLRFPNRISIRWRVPLYVPELPNISDALLCEVAQRLRGAMRESDTVARLGGDEFTVVLPQIASAEDAERTASKVLEALNRPYLLHRQEVIATASVGVSVFPDHGEDAETLLNHADTAMYRVKGAGRAGCAMFDPTTEAGDATPTNALA